MSQPAECSRPRPPTCASRSPVFGSTPCSAASIGRRVLCCRRRQGLCGSNLGNARDACRQRVCTCLKLVDLAFCETGFVLSVIKGLIGFRSDPSRAHPDSPLDTQPFFSKAGLACSYDCGSEQRAGDLTRQRAPISGHHRSIRWSPASDVVRTMCSFGIATPPILRSRRDHLASPETAMLFADHARRLLTFSMVRN